MWEQVTRGLSGGPEISRATPNTCRASLDWTAEDGCPHVSAEARRFDVADRNEQEFPARRPANLRFRGLG